MYHFMANKTQKVFIYDCENHAIAWILDLFIWRLLRRVSCSMTVWDKFPQEQTTKIKHLCLWRIVIVIWKLKVLNLMIVTDGLMFKYHTCWILLQSDIEKCPFMIVINLEVAKKLESWSFLLFTSCFTDRRPATLNFSFQTRQHWPIYDCEESVMPHSQTQSRVKQSILKYPGIDLLIKRRLLSPNNTCGLGVATQSEKTRATC
jgi:hypothetical protein